MDQIVIGLDQNYLINLSGALFNKTIQNPELWHSILGQFVDLIFKRNKIICPYSEFTEREASTGFHRVPILKELSKLLSKGWDFKYWSSNLILQLVCNLLTIFNKPCPQNIDLGRGKSEYRRIYLKSGSRYANVKITNISDLKAMVEYYTERYLLQFPNDSQEKVTDELLHVMHDVNKAQPYTFAIHADSLIKEMMQSSNIFFSVMEPWLTGIQPDLDYTDKISKIIWLTYWQCYPLEKIPFEVLLSDLQSEGWDITQVNHEFINALHNSTNYEIPFIKVWATLWEYFQKYPGSFSKNMRTASWDFFRVSSMLPACDVYCTDEEMKQALYRTGLVEYFGVTVYDSTKDSLRKIISHLNSLTDNIEN